MKSKIIAITIILSIFYVFVHYVHLSNEQVYSKNSESDLLDKVYHSERRFFHRSQFDSVSLSQLLINDTYNLYNNFPSEQNKAVLYGVIYGIHDKKNYNDDYLKLLQSNNQQNVFINHYCINQTLPVENTINPIIKDLINNTIDTDNSLGLCKDTVSKFISK